MDLIININSEIQFEYEIQNGFKSTPNNKLIVITFYAKWCDLCKTIAPFVHKLSINFPHVRFLNVDVEKFPVITEAYNINAMPTFVFVKNQDKIDEIKGANASGLESKVKEYSMFNSLKKETSVKTKVFGEKYDVGTMSNFTFKNKNKIDEFKFLNTSKLESKVKEKDLINSIRKDFSIYKRKDRKTIPNEIRRKLVECLDKEMCSRKEASEIFGIPYTTVTSIYKKYCTLNIIDNKIRTQFKAKKLGENHILKIKNWLMENCALTLKEIQTKLKEEFEISISENTINRAISNFHFTIKRLPNLPNLGLNDALDDERKRYCSWIMNAIKNERYLLFIDETKFKIMMRRFHKKTQFCGNSTAKIANLKIRNKTVMAVISKYGLLHYKLFDGSENQEKFLEFLDEVMLLLFDAGIKNVAFILNDVFSRKCGEIQNIITNNGHELIFLPPSSPDFNPLESLFSKWESIVRNSSPEDEEQLMSSIINFKEILTSEESSIYFELCVDKCQTEISLFNK